MPDFFDRLAARHDPAGGPVRLRPRLPGPFERVDSLPAVPEPEAPAARAPASPPMREREVRRVEREVRTTDRITVVRDESSPPERTRQAETQARQEKSEPTVRPETPSREVFPEHPRPAPAASTEPEAAEPVRERGGALRAAVLAPAPAESPRTRTTAAAAAPRPAPAARRRAAEPAEPAVRVEIGRLQVSAAPPQRPPERPRSGRREPAVNLADYLDERATS